MIRSTYFMALDWMGRNDYQQLFWVRASKLCWDCDMWQSMENRSFIAIHSEALKWMVLVISFQLTFSWSYIGWLKMMNGVIFWVHVLCTTPSWVCWACVLHPYVINLSRVSIKGGLPSVTLLNLVGFLLGYEFDSPIFLFWRRPYLCHFAHVTI